MSELLCKLFEASVIELIARQVQMAQRLIHTQHLCKVGEALVGNDVLSEADFDKRRVHLQQV